MGDSGEKTRGISSAVTRPAQVYARVRLERRVGINCPERKEREKEEEKTLPYLQTCDAIKRDPTRSIQDSRISNKNGRLNMMANKVASPLHFTGPPFWSRSSASQEIVWTST